MAERTIQIGPRNWVETADLLLVVIRDGTAEGYRQAREEIMRMASAADKYNELISERQEEQAKG